MDILDEKIIVDISKDIKLPYSYEMSIKTALKDTKKFDIMFFIRNIIIAIVSLLSLLCGSIGVYAVTGGKIEGVPVLEWLGIKFSDSYVEYKEEVKEKKISYNETSVELVSTLGSDYVTVLEFNVKLSDKDKEYLRLGESLYTEKDDEEFKEMMKKLEDTHNAEKVLTNDPSPFPIIEEGEDDILNEQKNMYIEVFDERKKYTNTIQLGFNKEKMGEELDFLRDFPNTKDNIFLDGEQVYCRNYQSIEKISDNEYKVYYVLLITDDILKEKTHYNITFKNCIITNQGQLKEGEKPLHDGSRLSNTPNNARRIDIDKEISVEVSKEKILENSKIIKLENKKSSYKNVTQEIDEVSINPIQTIIRTRTIISGVASNRRYFYDDKLQNPLWMDFKITDGNGKELENQSFETKKILTKGDGTVEEWYPGDIDALSSFKNGTFELTEYIIVENNNTNKLKITPYFQSQKMQEDSGLQDIDCDLETIEIDLT